jgi:hypothetical protein
MSNEQTVIVGVSLQDFWTVAAARRVGGASVDIALVSPEHTVVMRLRLYKANPETPTCLVDRP